MRIWFEEIPICNAHSTPWILFVGLGPTQLILFVFCHRNAFLSKTPEESINADFLPPPSKREENKRRGIHPIWCSY